MPEIGVNKVILIGQVPTRTSNTPRAARPSPTSRWPLMRASEKATESKGSASSGCDASHGESWRRFAGST